MKKILLILLIFLIKYNLVWSCAVCQKDGFQIMDACHKESISTLIGDWGIYATQTVDTILEKGFIIYKSTETVFNGITNIRFDSNGTGLHYNLEDTISFEWEVVNNKLSMFFNCEAIKKPFGNDKCNYKFNIVKKDNYLELYIYLEKIIYVLRRSSE